MSTEMTPRSLLIKITCGSEAAERANQAWTVAAMGVAAGASVSVWLTGEAVWFAAARRELLVEDLVDSATIQGAASFVEAALTGNVQALVY